MPNSLQAADRVGRAVHFLEHGWRSRQTLAKAVDDTIEDLGRRRVLRGCGRREHDKNANATRGKRLTISGTGLTDLKRKITPTRLDTKQAPGFGSGQEIVRGIGSGGRI